MRRRPRRRTAASGPGSWSPGTEVLTGIISDRNGPWLSERLREIGVDAAMIQIVGDRPEDLLAALRFMRDAGDGADHHQRRAGPDRRRPHRRDRRALLPVARWCSTSALEERIAEILRPLMQRWPGLDPEAIRRGPTASRRSSREGATILDPVGTAPGLVVPPARRRRPDRGRAAGAAARASADVGDGPRRPRRFARRSPARRVPARDRAAVRDPGVRDRQHAARGGGRRAGRWTPLEITTCLRRGEIEVSTRLRAAGRGGLRRVPRLHPPSATPTRCTPTDGSTVDDQVAELLRRPHARGRPSRAPAGCSPARLTDRGGLLGLLPRRRGRLLQRGQGRTSPASTRV